MQHTKMPDKPEQVNKQVVKSIFGLELAAQNYHKLLQEAENIIFTKENINQDYSCLKMLRDIKGKLKALKDASKRPFIDANSSIEEAFKELNAPIDDILTRKITEFTKINDEIKAENLKIQQCNERKQQTQQAITIFINNITISITNAATDAEIIRIQKAIGSEKARVGYYYDYIDTLRTACDNLNQLINDRKSFIRQQAVLKNKELEALESGNDNAAIEIKIKREILDAEMNENTIRIQEKAFDQAVNIETIIPESTVEVVAPRRISWKWRVDDIQSLHKKMPHLVDIVPNKGKIDDLLTSKKAEGALKDIEELKIFGITFYLDKLY